MNPIPPRTPLSPKNSLIGSRFPMLQCGAQVASEETMISDKTGRFLVAVALMLIALTLTVGSAQLLMRLKVLR
jgi:hypothetical protein